MRSLIALGLVLAAGPALAAPAIPFHDMIAGAIDGYARPGFAALATATDKLRTDTAALCATPSPDALKTAQDDFRQAVLALAHVEFLQMGPLSTDNRMERLLFWPDVKGIALRQVQTAVASNDVTASTPEGLKAKSVAMQGLGAVEYLLFGTGSDDLNSAAGGYRCSYAASAATLIAGVAASVSQDWADTSPQGFAAQMLSPQPSDQNFRTELEVIDKLAATLTFGTDSMRDQRLSPVLSFSTGTPKPRSALFWRSGMTGRSLAADFQGIEDFFKAAKFPEALAGQYDWISKGALFEFDNAVKAASDIPASVDQAVADPGGLKSLKQLYVSTGSLDTLLGDNLSAALGLSTGFSALDGD